jgi:hypothetical protein
LGVPADDTDNNTAIFASAHGFPELDPLVLELCASAGLPAWADPMLEEFAALLVVSRPIGVPALGCPPTTATAS